MTAPREADLAAFLAWWKQREKAPAGKAPTFREALEAFRLRPRQPLAPETEAQHRNFEDRWLYRWGDHRLDELDPAAIEAFFSDLLAAGRSGIHLNRHRLLLRRFFRFAQERGWMAEDPTRTIPRYDQRTRKDVLAWTDEELARLLRACAEPYMIDVEGPRHRDSRRRSHRPKRPSKWKQPRKTPPWLFDLVLLASRTLLRMRSLRELRWEHVNLARRTLRVPAEYVKTRRAILIPIAGDAFEMLKRRGPGEPSAKVFADLPNRVAIHRAFVGAVRRAGIRHASFHNLRKSGATALIRAGVPIPVVQRMGGWTQADVLLAYYIEIFDADLRKAADVLGAFGQPHPGPSSAVGG